MENEKQRSFDEFSKRLVELLTATGETDKPAAIFIAGDTMIAYGMNEDEVYGKLTRTLKSVELNMENDMRQEMLGDKLETILLEFDARMEKISEDKYGPVDETVN